MSETCIPVQVIVIVLCTTVENVWAFQVIAERPNLTYVNYDYLVWAKVSVMRYNRRSLYYTNVELQTKHTWGDNITVNMVFYEFLSNDYRRSFVELHMPLCKLLNEEAFLGGMLLTRLSGKTCPFPPGEYRLNNMTVPSLKSRYVWPFIRARIHTYIVAKEKNETIAEGVVYVTIK